MHFERLSNVSPKKIDSEVDVILILNIQEHVEKKLNVS